MISQFEGRIDKVLSRLEEISNTEIVFSCIKMTNRLRINYNMDESSFKFTYAATEEFRNN